MNVLALFSLAGKTALVTGGNKGIGMSMALALAEAGADIIVVSNSIELTGSEIEKEVTALGRSFKVTSQISATGPFSMISFKSFGRKQTH